MAILVLFFKEDKLKTKLDKSIIGKKDLNIQLTFDKKSFLVKKNKSINI